MQAIILAAGMAKRLRPLTDTTPKCLLKAGGKTLLEMTIENILANGIKSFVMVTGYRENMIKEHITEKFPGLDITYLTNSDYENNNNSYSLWMTKGLIKGESILLDSDILFDSRIISRLLEHKEADCLAVKCEHPLGEEEIKVIIDSANKIEHIGKQLDPAASFGESIGIERFSFGFFSKLGEILDRKISKENNVNEFYEASFQELYDLGNAMFAVDVSEYKCMEIDTPADLERAQEEVKGIQHFKIKNSARPLRKKLGIFNSQKDRYKNFNVRYNRPSMFGGFSFFPPVIKYLLISNIAIFIFQHFIFASFKVGGVPLSIFFLKYFALNPIGSDVFPFYPWQLFTYLFMHGGFWHLFLNMFALWMFGMELENIWGSKKFLTYYLMCGVGAGLANILLTPLFTGLQLPTVGASGSVYGILVAFGMLFPNREIMLYFLFPIKAKYFVIIYMVIELLSVGSNSGVAHFAHLGGGLIGFIYLLITRNNVNDLFRFDKKPKVTPNRPTNIYRNKYYEKYNTGSGGDDISDGEYYSKGGEEQEITQERVDEILDKIGKSGYQNLTEEEKKILFEASKKIN